MIEQIDPREKVKYKSHRRDRIRATSKRERFNSSRVKKG